MTISQVLEALLPKTQPKSEPELIPLQKGMLVYHVHEKLTARVLNIKPDPFWFDFMGGEPELLLYCSPDDMTFGNYWHPADVLVVSA